MINTNGFFIDFAYKYRIILLKVKQKMQKSDEFIEN